jgi:hypothetical protein
MDREQMVDFIVRNASGNTSERDIRNYYTTVNLGVVENDYQRLLQHEKLRITSKDAETVKAEQSAQQAQTAAAQALQQYKWMTICNTVVNGRTITDCAANKSEVASWFDPVRDTQGVSSDWFRKILTEQPQLARRLAWANYQSTAEQQQQKAETDAQTLRILLDVCRQFNYSFSLANQEAVTSAFPNGLVDAHELETAIQSGTVHLHGADWSEIEDHTKALVRAHNVKWANRSIADLKANSGQERQEREAIFSRVALEPKRHIGATPLPVTLTAEVIRKADTETIRMWIQRYSRASLNDRLSGVS